MILYKNIDYLEFNASSDFTEQFCKWFVSNSDEVIDWDYSFTLLLNEDWTIRKDIDRLKIINIYSERVPKRNTRVWYLKAVLDKNGWKYRIVLSWVFFSFYPIDEVHRFFERFHIHRLHLYRLDYCMDILWIPPSHLESSQEMHSKYKRVRSIFKNPLWWKDYINWFSMWFQEHEFKAYDKMIDVIDNWKIDYDPHYVKYQEHKEYITRVELKIKRRWLKKYILDDVNEMFRFWEKKLTNFMRKYFIDVYELYKSDYRYERKEIIKHEATDFNILYKTYCSYFEKIKDLYNNKTAKFYEIKDWEHILQDNTKLWKKIIANKMFKMQDEINEMLFKFDTE